MPVPAALPPPPVLLAAGDELSGYALDGRPFLTTALLILLVGAGLWALTLAWTAWIMHRPPRMTGGRALARLGRMSPADVGLAYEPMDFDVPARAGEGGAPGRCIRLSGWWLPHPAGVAAVRRSCIVLHGYGDSKAGALAWAPMLASLGFHLLLLDLRAHGESGGRLATGGQRERDDLCAVLGQLRQRHPAATRRLVLFGISYGATVAAACAAQRHDIGALVLESPVDGWASATRRYAELLGLPLAHAHGLRLRMMERLLGTRFEPMRPVNTLAGVKCPTLAILPSDDVLVSPAESAAIAEALNRRPGNEIWRVDTTHNLALATHAAEYRKRLSAFFERLPSDA